MNAPKVLRLFIVMILASSVLLDCSKERQPLTPQPVTRTKHPEQAVAPTPVVVEVGPTPTAEEGGSVLVLVRDQATSLDPYLMVGVHPEGSIASHLWDTLTLLNDDLQIEPHLAESWRPINNFTWEFTLRQGITFHNGEPVNAWAVRFSIERAKNMSGSLETFPQAIGLQEIEVMDDYVLRVTSFHTVPNMPYHFAFLEILPPVYYAEAEPSKLAIAPIGSGPYQVGEWIRGERLVLDAIPSYWKGAPVWSHITFQAVPDEHERVAALRSGDADLVTDLPPTQAADWDPDGGRLAAIESTRRMLIGISVQESSPLADRRVRQALNYGVDVAQIVDDRLEGYGERYGSWVNPPNHNPELAPWPYDPQRARSLLAEAGYPEGFATTLYTPDGVYYEDVAIALAIAEQLGEIGVDVQVEVVNWSVYVLELLSGDPPPLFLLAMNSRGDGLEDVRNLSTNFAYNPTGWQDDDFELRLAQASSIFEGTARSKLLDKAQAIAYAQAPWIWLWRQYNFYGVGSRLDWAPRPDGLVNLYRHSEINE